MEINRAQINFVSQSENKTFGLKNNSFSFFSNSKDTEKLF